MKKFFKKILGAFGAKQSIAEKLVRPSEISDVELEEKLKKGDIDFLIAYLKDGGDINRYLLVEVRRYVDQIDMETRKEIRLPIDLVKRQDIRDLMRRHGAISYTECPEDIQRYEAELRRKAEEAEKLAEQKTSEEIQNKIKDYESGL